MADLLDAIDALTKPIVEHLPQKDDSGKWLKVHTVTHLPLLTQLADAVTSSIGSGGRRGGSQASEMNMLDSEALYEFGKITAQISGWCRSVHVATSRDATVDLRRWYVAYIAQPNTDDEFYRRLLESWAHTIRGKLDPPRRVEVELPCPICGQAKWTDAEGNELAFPIVVEYRDYGTVEALKPRALCRSCDAFWQGFASIEELGDELKERHAESFPTGTEDVA